MRAASTQNYTFAGLTARTSFNKPASPPLLPYASLLTLNRYDAQPLYQQLATRLTQQIRQGRLAPGAVLPSSRKLSALLGLHRQAVVAAYAELLAQGWLETVARKGLFVAAHLRCSRSAVLYATHLFRAVSPFVY